ncbi:hypothetical protein ABZT03_28770 [Streptomyces sp. NPDC005574]|uniref:protein kinase domain-containing protein n=1 Tax=Streptomyces sp. NPDC005574 TaxID=3156891 RepID=UPI0033BAA6AA
MRTPSGSWPTLVDFQSAVARLEQCGEEPRLKRCRPRLDADGQPGADCGSFGAVYRLEDPQDGRLWALKCFTRDEPHRKDRYREIANCLRGARGSWRTEVHYLHNGLWVQARWWPVVLMEWAPGKRLTEWVDQLLDQRRRDTADELRRLAYRFASAVYQMHRSGISHGDLQSGNILVTAETEVRFVDYDAMTVPTWSLPPRREDGHPDFRLPREGERGPDGATQIRHTEVAVGTVFTPSTANGIPIQEPDALVAMHRDRFPSHVIYSTLVMLSHDLSLWKTLHQPGSDHLLLSRKDFRDPAQSAAWRTLLNHNVDEVRGMARRLLALLQCPVDLQPDLEPQPEVASQADVLRPMAYRPTTGPRPATRPFLDLGIFPAPDEPQDPRPVPAAKPTVAPTAKPGPVPAAKPGPVPAAKPGPVPTAKPGPVRAQGAPVGPKAEPRPVRGPGAPVGSAADATQVRAARVRPAPEPAKPEQPQPPRPAWLAPPFSTPVTSVPAPEQRRSPGLAPAAHRSDLHPTDLFADCLPLLPQAPSSRLVTGARITLALLGVLLVALVAVLLFVLVR